MKRLMACVDAVAAAVILLVIPHCGQYHPAAFRQKPTTMVEVASVCTPRRTPPPRLYCRRCLVSALGGMTQVVDDARVVCTAQQQGQ